MGKGRAPCCDKSKVNKGPWSPAEDLRLINFIQKYGHSNWRALPKMAGLLRCGKSCRLRWINYLRPDVKRGNFTHEEEQTIINLHNAIGNKWSKIASYLPGRTDNEIKNVWNTYLKKRVRKARDELDKNDQTKNDTKMDYSASPSSASSSSITTSGQKTCSDQESEVTNKPNEIPDLVSSVSEPKDVPNAHSSTGSNATSPNQELGPSPKSEAINSELISEVQNDGKLIEIPFESDVDFWELLDCMDPPQSSNENSAMNCGLEECRLEKERSIADENECKKWLNFLENELGLGNDADHLPMGPSVGPISSLDTEIGPTFDYFPLWPFSPQNLGI